MLLGSSTKNIMDFDKVFILENIIDLYYDN